jgi:hypothetical protein
MKLSRRDIIVSALAVSAVQAQEPPTQDWMAVSTEQNRRSAEALDKVELPQSTEPAFSFKA